MRIPQGCPIKDYLNESFSCTCNKKHLVPIEYINIEENALLSITELLKSHHLQKSFLLFDKTTYSLLGTRIHTLFQQASFSYTSYTLDSEEPIPDERAMGEIMIHFDPECDHMIAIGSGTLNDLCRFISYRLKLPYFIIATAPSMDGFASNVAPLIVNHMKTTYEAHTPLGIIGDTLILKDAPANMIAAGIGDILGKYTCLCEWEIAHIITGEYHCLEIEKIVRHSLEVVVSNIRAAKQRSSKATQSIMEALVFSGIAMSFAGNSRPASGSEHHLSHYWEMMYLFQGKKTILHGTKVGIGTIAVLKGYELLMNMNIDFGKARENALTYSKDNWEAQIEATYYDAASSVIQLENTLGKNEPANVLSRIDLLEKNWQRIKSIVNHLPSADEIRSHLSTLGAPNTPKDIGLDEATFINSFLVAKDLRNRYGLLQILFDLGLSQEIAQEVWEYFTKY